MKGGIPMLSVVASVIAIFLFFLFIWLISYNNMKRKRKAYIHEKFGKRPKTREWNDAVKNYYDVVNESYVEKRYSGSREKVRRQVMHWAPALIICLELP